MKIVFMVTSKTRRETSEGVVDTVLYFQRVVNGDVDVRSYASTFELAFSTQQAHIAEQFPLGRRYVLTPMGDEW